MRRVRSALMLLVLVAAMTAIAQEKSNVLVTVDLSRPFSPGFFDRLHPTIYYRGETWALLAISSAQLDLARRAGHLVTVVDENPQVDGYRLVNRKKAPVVREEIVGADVLVERDGIVITKGEPRIGEARQREGMKSVPLRPLQVELDGGTVVGTPHLRQASDSLIAALVARVNPDSVRWFIQQLQNFGTRYAFASTRDTVANWIRRQFLRLGYADARRDSFSQGGVWHTNVVATLPGNGPTDEIIVFGGHHDSNSGYAMTSAPGADDNASGTAAALEAARILRVAGYTPEITIKFATYAAEEIGLVGSYVDASRMRATGKKVKLMINHDMIANNSGPYPGSVVRVYYYTGSEAWRELAKQTTNQFTQLVGLTGGANSGGSDSYSYWSQGYPAVYFFENEFSPVYHSPADTIGNCNINYCAEVIRASVATLLRAAAIPDAIPRLEVADRGDGSSLIARWSPGHDYDLAGYRVFVGTSSGVYGSSFLTTDTTAVIAGLTAGVLYYVGVAAVDADGNQGFVTERSQTPGAVPLAPMNFTVVPDPAVISLGWKANLEEDLLGYSVYRAENAGDPGVLLTPAPLMVTAYVDAAVQKHQYYYYTVRAVDTQLNESPPTSQRRSRLVSLDMGIMLVDETANGNGTVQNPSDAQVDEYYSSLLQGFTVTPYDMDAEGGIWLGDMGAHSTVIWHSDDASVSEASFTAREDIRRYLSYGGKFLFSGYRPGRAFTGSTSSSASYGPGDYMYDVFGISSTELKTFALFNGALPLASGYPDIRVDSSKVGSANNYHLRQIENVFAAPEGVELYTYDTAYDSASVYGAPKGKPVGVEVNTTGRKSVVLSFPLYYVKQEQARVLLNHVLVDRFGEVTGVGNDVKLTPQTFALEQNYPNPFNPTTGIRYQVPGTSDVRLSVYDMLGREVEVLVNERKAAGRYEVRFDASRLASGVYLYRLMAGQYVESRKMVLLR